jgi:uncharacterized protein (DUF58 family)
VALKPFGTTRSASTAADGDDLAAPGTVARTEAEAQSVASRLPDLLIEASRVAATIIHGIHGRRRAGPGETFWQFRQYDSNDDVKAIDWRRSATSDHVFVREREWEAAHTFWVWPDLSPSMAFSSHLSPTMKRDRALVVALAAVEVLVKGGERVGLLGVGRPTANRNATSRIAQSIAAHATSPLLAAGLPPEERLTRFSGVILLSDFLNPIPDLERSLARLTADGVNGHIVQVLDPAEEALPYDGRAEFVGMSNEVRWTAERAETLREAYLERFEAHRDAVRAIARKAGWSFTVHHTDRPATEPLLNLITQLQAGGQGALRGGGGR